MLDVTTIRAELAAHYDLAPSLALARDMAAIHARMERAVPFPDWATTQRPFAGDFCASPVRATDQAGSRPIRRTAAPSGTALIPGSPVVWLHALQNRLCPRLDIPEGMAAQVAPLVRDRVIPQPLGCKRLPFSGDCRANRTRTAAMGGSRCGVKFFRGVTNNHAERRDRQAEALRADRGCGLNPARAQAQVGPLGRNGMAIPMRPACRSWPAAGRSFR